MKINIVDEEFIIESKEVQSVFKKLSVSSTALTSEDIDDILKTIKRKKVKSKAVKDDIKTLAGMKSYIGFLEAEAKREDERYIAITECIDRLIEVQVFGGAIALAKWAENQGYELKEDCSCGR
jgi:transcriptional antiterminator